MSTLLADYTIAKEPWVEFGNYYGPARDYWVVTQPANKKPIGKFLVASDGSTHVMSHSWVDPAHRNKGIGSAAYKFLVNHYGSLQSDTTKTSRSAAAVWKKISGEPIANSTNRGRQNKQRYQLSKAEALLARIVEAKIKWIMPSWNKEKGEFERMSPGGNYLEWKPRLESAGLVTLTDEIWSKLQNSDSQHPDLTMADVKKSAKMYHRDPEPLIKTFTCGGTMEAPIIVHWGGGDYELVAGNTRLMVARVLGVRPQVAMIEFTDEDNRSSLDKNIKKSQRFAWSFFKGTGSGGNALVSNGKVLYQRDPKVPGNGRMR